MQEQTLELAEKEALLFMRVGRGNPESFHGLYLSCILETGETSCSESGASEDYPK